MKSAFHLITPHMIALLAAVNTTTALAEEQNQPPQQNQPQAQNEHAKQDADRLWSGEVALGYLQSSGNTNTTNFNGKSKAIRNGETWRNTYKLDGNNESSEDERTAEDYFASFKADYKLDEDSYLFGLEEYTDDRFSGYNYETSTTFGYGRVLIKNDRHVLSGDVGLGYRYSELDDGDVEEDAVVRVGGLYKWTINESTTLDEEFSVEMGEDKRTDKSLTKLQVKVNGNLWGFIAYEIKRVSDTPPDVKNSDRNTSVGLNYQF